jgi:transcriptional regulator with XRE-family HTH domain
MRNLSVELRKMRELLNMTQEELGQIIGKSARTIQRYEEGGKIGLGVLEKLSVALRHDFSVNEGELSESEDKAYTIRNNALLTVILDAQAEILANQTGKTVSEIRSSLLNSAETMEVKLRGLHDKRK